MQDPSLPPEIPKQSLAPLWIGLAALVAIIGVVGALASRPADEAQKSELAAKTAPALTPAPGASPAQPAAAPPALPVLEHELPPPPPARSIPAGSALLAAPGPSAASAPRDPDCDDPCRGRETPELLGSLRTKAGQARSCYERALSNDSSLAGKLEVALRVGANGAACSASIVKNTLRDAALESCALARFRGGKYPPPSGGCVDVSVPMNFMPAGSR